MMKRKALLTLMAASMLTIGGGTLIHAAFDENLNMYTLDAVVVEADKTKNKFGDTITEQSYYRTGGDVKVITREEIEKRHYTDLTEAIKRIPGVTFQNPGYRGGEYGYEFYNNGVSINGDTRVIVCVDGRRVDNAASTRVGDYSASGTKSTGVNLNQVTNMENVDKIEVIKGPGASVYGADATGGVINIITRKGGDDSTATVDVSTGSWHQHNYAVSVSGTKGDDKSLHYFISANRNMSGDTKYKDGFTGETGTLGGSRWKEDGVNIRIDKDFDANHSLKIAYNHKDGKDGYPIATPSMRYWNQNDWNRIIFNAQVGKLDSNNKLIWDGKYKEKGWRDPAGTKYETFVDDKGNKHEYTLDANGNRIKTFSKLTGDKKNPGYHNLYALDGALYNSFSKFNNNDVDVTYTFNKDNGMDSFVRLYSQRHRYMHRDKYSWTFLPDASNAYNDLFPTGATSEQLNKWIADNLAPFPGSGDQKAFDRWLALTGGKAGEPTSWHDEQNKGIQLQLAKSLGIHDVIASVTYDKARNYSRSISNGVEKSSYVQRKTLQAYVQDKIHLTDKWDFTPAIRYAKYSSFEHSTGNTQGKGDTHDLNYTINTEYMFNDSTSMYAGWTKVFRPLREGDYSEVDGVFKTPLKDEEGNAWTFGVRKELSDKTTLAVHYDITKMTNAIATLPIWDEAQQKPVSTAVNAKEDKQSFNFTVDHQFNDHLTLSASYSHMKDKWKAKPGWILDDSWGYANESDINTAINSLRPQNHYSLNLSYENGKLYTGLLTNWYTGCSEHAFTNRRFLVLDWNVNYQLTPNMNVYLLINNLTNEGYETSYNSWNGIGSSSMPGRSVLVGAKYTF